ncbi:MAG: alpha-amylase family glycosyl hydrolase [Myxococcota bacterium]
MDYLADLGIDAIWLTPFNPSPQVDFGYDVSDYRNIDPLFGTLEDFDRLVAAAHQRNIRVVVDIVLNHTSDQHPYFLSSRKSRKSPHRDWYIWRDPKNGGPPNNWASIFEPSAWTFDKTTQQYYYHAFYSAQPDLNWRNPEVERAMFDVLRFWLDRGVDGFRLDAVAHLFEDERGRNNPLQSTLRAGSTTEYEQEHRYTMFHTENYAMLRKLRTLVEGYPGDRLLIGEAYTDTAADLLPFYSNDLGVQLPFNFLLMGVQALNAEAFRYQVGEIEGALRGLPTTYVLSNHDRPRSYDRFADHKNDQAIAKLLATMLLTLRGAPFIYYGEEIGMVTTEPTSLEQVRDPMGRRYWPENKGRDGERTPMQWDASKHAGFSKAAPWLPIPASAKERNVRNALKDPQSILQHYRRLLRMRREHPSLRLGKYKVLNSHVDIFAYQRYTATDRVTVALNMSDQRLNFKPSLAGHSSKIVSSLGRILETVPGTNLVLEPYEALVFY